LKLVCNVSVVFLDTVYTYHFLTFISTAITVRPGYCLLQPTQNCLK